MELSDTDLGTREAALEFQCGPRPIDFRLCWCVVPQKYKKQENRKTNKLIKHLMKEDPTLSVCSYNINGYNDTKIDKLLSLVKYEKIMLIAMQETHDVLTSKHIYILKVKAKTLNVFQHLRKTST